MKQGLLPSGLGLALLEAQAATGAWWTPHRASCSLCLSPAAGPGGPGAQGEAAGCRRAATGYPDPYGGKKLSLFQAIGKEVVDRVLGWNWLEAQLATGGLVVICGVRVAPELACQQGLLDQETWHGLLNCVAQGAGFLDPNTLEQLPYQELLARCVQAPSTGLALLPLRITFRTLGGAVSLAELLGGVL